MLVKLGVSNAPLETQYQSMIDLYGRSGINDAAVLIRPTETFLILLK